MDPLHCPACRVETQPGHARVEFRGAPRRVRVTRGRVAAGICPRCHAPAFAPAMRAHLDAIAAIVQHGLDQPAIVTIERVRPGVREAA